MNKRIQIKTFKRGIEKMKRDETLSYMLKKHMNKMIRQNKIWQPYEHIIASYKS